MTTKPVKSAQYYAVVPAAGCGERMQSATPKQYLKLLGESIILHSIAPLLSLSELVRCVVVLSDNDKHWSHQTFVDHPKVMTAIGGVARSDSVLNGLQALAAVAHDEDWVLVHGATRPCVTLAAIERLIEATREHPVGGILGVPIVDTLKHADKHIIQKTVSREKLWAAHTPQLFRYGLLKQAITEMQAKGVPMTDDAGAMEYLGLQSLMVLDDPGNIKVTYPEDLAWAEMILQARSNQCVSA